MRDLLLLVIAVLAVTGNAFAELHEIPTKCPESSGKTVQLAHKHDCTKFYECSNGQKQLSNCPEFAPGQKLHFDPELQNCIFPWEANCASRAPDCSKDEFIQPHPTNCSLYYKCENGEKVLKTCDEEQLFCSESLECVDRDAAKCKVYDSCPTGKLLEAVLLPHYRESLYYECVDGQDVVRRCPSGHVFDKELRQCVSKVHCPETGTKRISHETDCGLYYECVDGVKVEKACEDGMSFDESKGICTWSSPRHECSKEKNIIDCPPEGYTFLPHECSCTKYYSCEDGDRFIQQCPEGMMYDYIRKVCDLSRAAICWNQMYTDDNYLDPNCYNSTDCPIYSHARFPHKECRFYYECKGGSKCLRRCSEGHVFNPNLQLCDLPKNVPGCGGGGSNEPDDTTPNNTDNECTSCNCNNCIVRSAYPEDCNLYYQCEYGQKVIKRCPRNLVFDHINQICDYQENVHCIPTTTSITTPTPTTTTTERPYCIEGKRKYHECQCQEYYECHHGRYQWFRCSSDKLFDWKLLECVAKDRAACYSDRNKDCEGTCSSSTSRLPHKDCNKYCNCYQGTATVETCPRHQYYDRGTQDCQWPENISYWGTQCNPSDCSFGINYVPHECHCDQYYSCLGNPKTIERCGNGQYFDYREERCVDSRYAHCYVSPSCDEAAKKCGTCETTKHNTSNYAGDCQKYCRCSDKNVYIEQCASGLYYDPESGECAWPENVDLKSQCSLFITDCTRTSKFVPHNCQCKLYYECAEGVKYLAVCPGGSSFDYVRGFCVNKEAHCYHEYSEDRIPHCIGHCPEQTSSSPIVRLQHRDCDKYCICSMGAPYIVNCPNCTRYDSQQQTCVPSDVCNCSLRANKTLWSDIPFVSNFL